MRIKKLLRMINTRKADAALITAAENVTYYSGFTGASSQLLITRDERFLFTDFRYGEQAEAQTNFTVIETKAQTRVKTIFELAEKHKAGKIGADLRWVLTPAYKAYAQHMGENNIIDLSDDISSQRAVKDSNELALIEKGARHNDLLFFHLCGLIREGITELDIKAEIIYYMHKNGAESAFAPIVASGENTSLPHAAPSGRKLKAGDLLTMDYGCKFEGYCSDFTRTAAISYMDKERQKVYDIVNRAGEIGIAALKAGEAARVVDAASRDYIAKSGYASAFGHGLGHGVGLFIHEEPAINEVSDAVLKEGMAVTIEPGIYIEGRFGIRIEDLCIVKNGGCVNLTVAPREVTII